EKDNWAEFLEDNNNFNEVYENVKILQKKDLEINKDIFNQQSIELSLCLAKLESLKENRLRLKNQDDSKKIDSKEVAMTRIMSVMKHSDRPIHTQTGRSPADFEKQLKILQSQYPSVSFVIKQNGGWMSSPQTRAQAQ